MMRMLILVGSLFLLPCVRAQERTDTLSIPGRFDTFTTDELGHVYTVHGDVLEIFDPQGRRTLRNSLKTFGTITAIDAFYSLKPMVFSREQGQLAVLDNTLAVQGSVMSLSRGGYPQAVLACMSVQNNFWLYDEREMALLRVDGQLRELANTGRLDQLLGFTPKPVALQEHDSRLYFNDPEQGILVFDLFGTYMKTLGIRGVRSFEVRGDQLFFLDAQGAQVYDMKAFVTTPITAVLPAGVTLRDMRVERGRIYLLLDDRILVRNVWGDRE